MDLLNECNVIKYSAYRTAAKIRALQRSLHLEHVRLGIVSGVFYRHNLHPLENNVILNRQKLESVVYDILFAAQKESSNEMDVVLATEKIVQFIYSVYDICHTGIKIISAKVALTVLSCARLQEKYRYLFHQLADHNSCLRKKRMEILLTELAAFAEYLSETVSFGVLLIPSTLSSCFQHCDGNLGVTEENFMCWLLNEPQMLVWLSTLYRLQIAEKVCHNIKCDFCKVQPVRGLRYMCLVCFKYNQCQTCFFLGRVNKRHKLKHPMQEYCFQTSSKEATCAFLKVLRNKFKRHPVKDLQYLPAECQDTFSQNQYENCNDTFSALSIYHSNPRVANDDLSSRTVVNFCYNVLPLNPQTELQSIIHNLEEENRQLLAQIEERNDKNFGNYLEDHKKQIGAQVERLKSLKFHLAKVQDMLPLNTVQSVKECRRRLCRLESTPMIPKSVKKYKQGLSIPSVLDSISPIIQDVDRGTSDLNLTLWPNNEEENISANDVEHNAQHNHSNTLSLSEQSVNDLSVRFYQGSADHVPSPENGISEWILDSAVSLQSVHEINEDIDSIIEKLQKVLSSNFSFQDSLLFEQDNSQLQEAAAEMEGLLAGLIKNIEHKRSGE